MEYNVDFEEAFNYVPSVPLRTNSTLINAKRMESKGPRLFKKKKEEHYQESDAMLRFLSGSSQPQKFIAKKYDPSF